MGIKKMHTYEPSDKHLLDVTTEQSLYQGALEKASYVALLHHIRTEHTTHPPTHPHTHTHTHTHAHTHTHTHTNVLSAMTAQLGASAGG